MPRFSVVTACRNSARYIEETVKSVLSQRHFLGGRCELEYLVCDGASTDGTVELLAPYRAQGVTVVSEPDTGFYAALAKGLQRVSGDYVAYLNAGDLFHAGGLAIAAECFELPGVDWLTGYAVTYNDRAQVTRCELPLRYRRNLFQCGAYGTLLPFLQQESTVWRRSLHAAVDFDFLAKLRFAGDGYLWKCFASVAELCTVRGQIGGFRVHRGQISERLGDYLAELRSFSRAPTLAERLQCLAERLLWAMPGRVSKSIADLSTRLLYDHQLQSWRRLPYLNP